MAEAADLPLSGTTALVTGGSGGIGSAAARALVRDGCSVVIMARNAERLESVAEEVRGAARGGATVVACPGDAGTVEDLERGLEAACKPTGVLNICVAVVGGGTVAPFLALSEADVRADLEKSILPAFIAIKYSTPHMVRAGSGSIVCISSQVAALTSPLLAAYSASKAGLEALVRAAADELSAFHIRVNCIRPGTTLTTNVGGWARDPEIEPILLEQTPLGRLGQSDDIGAGVRYFAGPESSWVTGQSLGIEGGNELRRMPSMEILARRRLGDDVVNAALRGEIPQ